MIRIESQALGTLIALLRDEGFTVVGPTVKDAAVILDEIRSLEDLPIGWADEQSNASYKLRHEAGSALFRHAVGPQSWKKFLFPSNVELVRSQASRGELTLSEGRHSAGQPYAFLGVRPCELHAILIQDTVFMRGRFADPLYTSAREQAFIVAVQCTQPGGTCFCASMKTGPRIATGYDLVLTEFTEGGSSSFLVDAGSDRGAALMERLPGREARHEEILEAERLLARAEASMGRTLDTEGLPRLLYDNLSHPSWDVVGHRCLACANCTLVCPTCFCSTVTDLTDLTGSENVRTRLWDSCFTSDFSYIHGGSVRPSTRGRYRQWMTHKLASWVDQFGTFGCVGCGRCITWCPVGIDLTEEAKRIRNQPHTMKTP